jgi:hypothetical protein
MERNNGPSERRNQAAKYLKVFLSFFISAQRSIPPNLLQENNICRHAARFSGTSALIGPEESHTAAGREKNPHQTPLIPIASLRDNVDPFSLVTGISAIIRRMMPARYPVAIPLEDMREVAVVSAFEYSALASTSAGDVPDAKRPAFSESSTSSESSVGREASARAAAALVTSSEFRARDGK